MSLPIRYELSALVHLRPVFAWFAIPSFLALSAAQYDTSPRAQTNYLEQLHIGSTVSSRWFCCAKELGTKNMARSVSKKREQAHAAKMIRELRGLGYTVELVQET